MEIDGALGLWPLQCLQTSTSRGVSAARSTHIAAWCIDDSLDVDVLKTSRGESRLLELWWREREAVSNVTTHYSRVSANMCIVVLSAAFSVGSTRSRTRDSTFPSVDVTQTNEYRIRLLESRITFSTL